MRLQEPFRRARLRASVAALSCLLAGAGMAQSPDQAGGELRVSGFGTFGMVHADAPAGWAYRRDIAQPAHGGGARADTDSRLGLQLNYAPNAQFELVGQALAMRRSRYAPDSGSIEWAFAAYRPTADWLMRVGRVNLDVFLMSDYRNVGFAYSVARPPGDFYGSLPTSFDGADIARVWNIEGTLWRAKAYVGRVHSGDLSADARIAVRPLLGAMVSREADGLQLRAVLTGSAVATTAPALRPLINGLSGIAALPVPEVAAEANALRSRFDHAGANVYYAGLGLAYELQDWQWGAEYMRVWGNPSANFKSAYAGVGRRFGPVTVFGGASWIDTPGLPVETPAWGAALAPVVGPAIAQQAQFLAAAAAYAANKGGANQRSLSLGARWDLKAQLALKVQWDRIHIGANGGRLWANSTLDAGRADVGSVVLDFVF